MIAFMHLNSKATVMIKVGVRVRVSCMVRFRVLVSFTVRVSLRVIQLAILFCNCEVTYTHRNVKLYLHLPHLCTSMVLIFSIAAFYKQSESDDLFADQKAWRAWSRCCLDRRSVPRE